MAGNNAGASGLALVSEGAGSTFRFFDPSSDRSVFSDACSLFKGTVEGGLGEFLGLLGSLLVAFISATIALILRLSTASGGDKLRLKPMLSCRIACAVSTLAVSSSAGWPAAGVAAPGDATGESNTGAATAGAGVAFLGGSSGLGVFGAVLVVFGLVDTVTPFDWRSDTALERAVELSDSEPCFVLGAIFTGRFTLGLGFPGGATKPAYGFGTIGTGFCFGFGAGVRGGAEDGAAGAGAEGVAVVGGGVSGRGSAAGAGAVGVVAGDEAGAGEFDFGRDFRDFGASVLSLVTNVVMGTAFVEAGAVLGATGVSVGAGAGVAPFIFGVLGGAA